MKTLIFLICLQFITAYSSKRELQLTIKILPEFLHEFKGKIITFRVDVGDRVIDTSFAIAEKHIFTFYDLKSTAIFIRIDGSVKLKDGRENYFWTGDKIIFRRGNKVNHQMKFPADCEVNKYFGGPICPKCSQKDKVIPILSGLLSPDTPGQMGVDYYPGSCIRTPCDPGWYCKRDTLEF